jgi:hypothetical protein
MDIVACVITPHYFPKLEHISCPKLVAGRYFCFVAKANTGSGHPASLRFHPKSLARSPYLLGFQVAQARTGGR